jgi:Lytic polysaccharide mono-oxygenase, cellulose-degrading
MCKPAGDGCTNLPQCADAFRDDSNGGYQYMSVLTHDVGRGGSMGRVSTLPTNVCGFDSETWQDGKTPWDTTGVDWPTTEVDPRSPLKMVWDVTYGPHFDDTAEFVHYITKDDFVFDPDRALTWDDFESESFCTLRNDPGNPSANLLVVPREADGEFDTWCTIPSSKRGRHIIYTEWGRNEWTFERFHGCIDIVVVNEGVPTSPVSAPPVGQPISVPVEGSVPVTYPCCGWEGDCEQPANPWCSSECGRCTSNCNGIFYTAPGVGSRSCVETVEEEGGTSATGTSATPTSIRQVQETDTDLNPENITYPCCGWNGDCQNSTNTFCHSECGRCTEDCNGIFYAGPQTPFQSCAGLPTAPPDETTAPEQLNPENVPYPCCGWNGDCQHPDNVWCHSSCDRCVGECEGVFYAQPATGGDVCDGDGNPIISTPTPTAVPTPVPVVTTSAPVTTTSAPVVTSIGSSNPTPTALNGITAFPTGPTTAQLSSGHTHRVSWSTSRRTVLVLVGLLV